MTSWRDNPLSLPVLLGLWAVLVAVALWLRPLLPVDETRYVSVAWEMWLRGDFLVPYLNGEPYHHKPPLLFWLMQAGWAVFGVNEWWPRLVAPLASLLDLVLVARLARRLWPQLPELQTQAAWMLFGLLLWTGFLTLTQFDLLIVCFTLLGMLGVLRAAAGERSGWIWLGLALGLGILSKGPVILLQVLPAALLAPVWVERKPAWRRWYPALLGSVLLGAAIALAWAIPAGIAGGEAYRHAIFWGQTADRMVDSFAHKQPVWWYLPWLPVMLLPWILWGRVWRGILQRPWRGDAGVRFLLAWVLPVLIAFSLISGKQTKYLLPLLPAAVLLLARLAAAAGGAPRRAWLPGLMLIAGGLVLALLPFAMGADHAYWLDNLPVWPGAGLATLGVLALILPAADGSRQILRTTVASVLLIIGVHVSVLHTAAPAYDLKPFALRLKALQDRGVPIAHVGKYHDQFHFLGRLEQPLEVIPQWEVRDWVREHPNGYVVLYYDTWKGPREGAEVVEPYRGDRHDLALWTAADLAAAMDAAAGQ